MVTYHFLNSCSSYRYAITKGILLDMNIRATVIIIDFTMTIKYKSRTSAGQCWTVPQRSKTTEIQWTAPTSDFQENMQQESTTFETFQEYSFWTQTIDKNVWQCDQILV